MLAKAVRGACYALATTTLLPAGHPSPRNARHIAQGQG